MTQKDKDLLLKDLCARLPYGVKAYVRNWSKLDRKYYEGTYTVASIHPSLNTILAYSERSSVEVIVGYDDHEIKPYLFPMSSMTPEQENEWNDLFHNPLDELFTKDKNGGIERNEKLLLISKSMLDPIQWCYKNNFDILGFIPMGLAIDATGLNIY